MRSHPRSMQVTSSGAFLAPVVNARPFCDYFSSDAPVRRRKLLAALGLACIALVTATATASETGIATSNLTGFLTFNFTGSTRVAPSILATSGGTPRWRPPLSDKSGRPNSRASTQARDWHRTRKPFFLPPHASLLPDAPATELKHKILEPATLTEAPPANASQRIKPESATQSAVTVASPTVTALSPARRAAMDAQTREAILSHAGIEGASSKRSRDEASAREVAVAKRTTDVDVPYNKAVVAKSSIEVANNKEETLPRPEPSGPQASSNSSVEQKVLRVLPQAATTVAVAKTQLEAVSTGTSVVTTTENAAESATSTIQSKHSKTEAEAASQLNTTIARPNVTEDLDNRQTTHEEIGYATTAAVAQPFAPEQDELAFQALTKHDASFAIPAQILVPLPEAKPRREQLRRRAAARQRTKRRKAREKAKADRLRAAKNKARAKKKAPAPVPVQQATGPNWANKLFTTTN